MYPHRGGRQEVNVHTQLNRWSPNVGRLAKASDQDKPQTASALESSQRNGQTSGWKQQFLLRHVYNCNPIERKCPYIAIDTPQ